MPTVQGEPSPVEVPAMDTRPMKLHHSGTVYDRMLQELKRNGPYINDESYFTLTHEELRDLLFDYRSDRSFLHDTTLAVRPGAGPATAVIVHREFKTRPEYMGHVGPLVSVPRKGVFMGVAVYVLPREASNEH